MYLYLDSRSLSRSVNIVRRRGSFVAESASPRMYFDLPAPLVPGWYLFNAEIESETGRVRPRIFLPAEGGFDRRHSFPLVWSYRESYLCLAFVPALLGSLRLDPLRRPGAFSLGGLQVRRLGSSLAAALLARGARQLLGLGFESLQHLLPDLKRRQRSGGVRYLLPRSPAVPTGVAGAAAYRAWMRKYDFDPARDAESCRSAVARLEQPPDIAVVLNADRWTHRQRAEVIDSVAAQIYPHWSLVIVSGRSEPRRRLLRPQQQRDPRIKLLHAPEGCGLVAGANIGLDCVSAEWVVVLDGPGLLRPHALAEVARLIERHPGAELVYADEDRLDERGARFGPHFKPDFSLDLLYSCNYLGPFTVHRAANLRRAGLYDRGAEGCHHYDMALRVLEQVKQRRILHIPKILYHRRGDDGAEPGRPTDPDALRVLAEHLARRRRLAAVEACPGLPYHRLRWPLPEPRPLVSLIVPTRDRGALLRTCIESILQRSTYPNFEVLIADNGSTEPDAVAYLEALRAEPRVRILPFERPFNYSAINNFAAARASGKVLGLVNNDTEVLTPDWLEELVSHALRRGVGCVGAKLVYPDGTVQHGGVVLGLGGCAGHAHRFFPADAPGYHGRLAVTQNFAAVTAACLFIRKKLYQAVGGMNETDLPVALNDVDLCLRVRARRLQNVWTPFAVLRHFKSGSRGLDDTAEKRQRAAQERLYMGRTWGPLLRRDPYYSPNLTLKREDFSLRLE